MKQHTLATALAGISFCLSTLAAPISQQFPRSFLLRYNCPEIAGIRIDAERHIATGEGEIDGCNGPFHDFACIHQDHWEFAPPAPMFQGNTSLTSLPKSLISSRVTEAETPHPSEFVCLYDNGLTLKYDLENYNPQFARLFPDMSLHYLAQIG